jgi:hypothetical protein
LPATPTLIVLAGGLALGSVLDVVTLRAICLLSAFLSAFAVGIFLPFGLTVTVPFMPACTLQ